MMVMHWKIIIPTLFAAVFALGGCKEVKDPEFRRIEKFGLKKVNLEEATVGFQVTYFNPNSFGVNVKEAEADIYIDSVFVGKFVQENTVNVGQNAEFSIPFAGSVPFKKAMEFNFDDIGNREVYLQAKGSAKIGKAGIFVTKPISYAGKHRLDEISTR
jgi:LEA14-like dessication related protein